MRLEDLQFLDAMLRARCGLTLRPDKGYFAEGRLAAVARRENLVSVEALVDRLRQAPDGPLAAAAFEALSVTDTAFFRDGAVFEHLGCEVLPALAGGGGPVRTWSAGCSTGQEPYSLAMLAETKDVLGGVDIVATDLSERALEKAHAGLYTQFEVQRGLPIRLLLQHFEKDGEMWAIAPRLRARIRWRRLNLLEDRRSVRPFQLVLCRYVLGYFDAPTRERVLGQLASALEPGGYLVLGPDDAPPQGFAAAGAPGVFRRAAASGLQAA